MLDLMSMVRSSVGRGISGRGLLLWWDVERDLLSFSWSVGLMFVRLFNRGNLELIERIGCCWRFEANLMFSL